MYKLRLQFFWLFDFFTTQKSFIFLVFLPFSWAAPMAYGGSQARSLIGAVATSLRQSHSNTGPKRATSATYTTAHGNTRSLTHWVRPGIEPATSWFLVGFVSALPWQELQIPISLLTFLICSYAMPAFSITALKYYDKYFTFSIWQFRLLCYTWVWFWCLLFLCRLWFFFISLVLFYKI